MSGCEYEQEDYCIIEETEGIKEPCPFNKGGHCTAKPEDLEEYCSDCDKPVKECECGANWVLCSDGKGKVVPIISKEYYDAINKSKATQRVV